MKPLKPLATILLLLVFAGAPQHAEAQARFGATPGYPSVSHFGMRNGVGSGYGTFGRSGYGSYGSTFGSGYGFGSYGGLGYGVVGYYGGYGGFGPIDYSGYDIGSGQLGVGYQAANNLFQPPIFYDTPLTTLDLEPFYSIVTSAPSVNRSRTRHVAHPHPSVVREQLLDDKGNILWPSTTLDGLDVGDARRDAESAVQLVVKEGKSTGRASVRHVLDAKNKLHAFAREALPRAKAKNVADYDLLEKFLIELGKSLETMAVNY